MTAVLAIENGNLDQPITIQQSELDEVPPSASVAQLQAGDRIRLRNLLYALMLPSGSDAAVVIANYIGGSTTNFVAMMNAKAQALGMTNTHYSNPHGFSADNHYSSAADLVKLARYAMANNSFFDQVVSQQSYVLDATDHNHKYTNWNNTNGLLGTYDGANGVKTGSSPEAGYCLVFSATRNGHHLIGAELNAPTYDDVMADATRILDKGFATVG
jgi:D-alanyl-D-alanine carboxypeptidase (penicillin-binding protein 5/6)